MTFAVRCASVLVLLLIGVGCAGRAQPPQVVLVATAPPTRQLAPFYTRTPTRTPSATPTASPIASATLTATASATVTATASATPSATMTASATSTATATPSATATAGLRTPTPAFAFLAQPNALVAAAPTTPAEGWSCDDFPCEDDLAGFLARLAAPPGFAVEHVGRLPGQPQQIAYGPDGRLYATVLLNGTRRGTVVAYDEATGAVTVVGPPLEAPLGLAFAPGSDVLYVSARAPAHNAGLLLRLPPGGAPPEVVRDDLPCCWGLLDNQPAGLAFGPDGWLYITVGALSDQAEPPDPARAPFAVLLPEEAALLRVHPHTGETTVYARGLRYAYDVTFDSRGQAYTSDTGLVAGPGDRVLRVAPGGHYGWPYWGPRGCVGCPLAPASITIQPDWVALPDATLPRGVLAYTGSAYPANLFDNVFVVLWNGVPWGQRVARLDPRAVPAEAATPGAFTPEPFLTGLIRPVDVAQDPAGHLVVADAVYGHVWRVRYVGPGG